MEPFVVLLLASLYTVLDKICMKVRVAEIFAVVVSSRLMPLKLILDVGRMSLFFQAFLYFLLCVSDFSPAVVTFDLWCGVGIDHRVDNSLCVK